MPSAYPGIRAIDDNHLTVRLSEPSDDFIQILTLSRFSILPENLRDLPEQCFL